MGIEQILGQLKPDIVAASTAREFGRLLDEAYQRALAMEQRLGKQHGQKHGYEVLHTDSADRRSAQWFTQTGKAFATGVASKCIACASCPTNRVVFSHF